jgi:CO/xanthine dehydrogenase Mo-binding subunit
MIGRMINVLSQRLQQRLGDLVASEFGHDSAQMTAEAGGLRGPDGRFHTIAEAASLSPADLHELLRYEPGPFDVVEVFVGLAAEVKVDRDTGRVEILRVANAHEVGRVIHPVMHQGQIDGGLVQGLGYAMSEGLEFDGGRVTNAALNEYKLPVAPDIPPLTTILLEPDLSLGITPIGEGPNCAMSACIVNAVVDALGQQVQIPIRPEALVGLEFPDSS